MANTSKTGAQSGSPQPVPSAGTGAKSATAGTTGGVPDALKQPKPKKTKAAKSDTTPHPAEGAPPLLEIPALFTGAGKSEAKIVADGETLVTRLLGQGDDSPLMEQFACGPYFMILKKKAQEQSGSVSAKGAEYNKALKPILAEAKVSLLGTTFKHVTWMLADARRWSMLQHLLSRMTEKERARFRTTATAYKKVMTELKSDKLKAKEATKKTVDQELKSLRLKESGEYLLADDEELDGFIDANAWNTLSEAEYAKKKEALDRWHQRMNQ
jgi:hypothetical protein